MYKNGEVGGTATVSGTYTNGTAAVRLENGVMAQMIMTAKLMMYGFIIELSPLLKCDLYITGLQVQLDIGKWMKKQEPMRMILVAMV